jgi:hypothetical protein
MRAAPNVHDEGPRKRSDTTLASGPLDRVVRRAAVLSPRTFVSTSEFQTGWVVVSS